MLDSLNNLEKINTQGKLGAIIINSKEQIENIQVKYKYFKEKDIDVVVVSKIIPTDELYSNCNFLIFDPGFKKNPKETIFDLAKEKNYTRVLLWENYVKDIFVFDLDYEGFLEQTILMSKDKEKFNYSFIEGAYLEIRFPYTRLYRVEFWDSKKGYSIYSVDMWSGNWSRTILQYYVDYHIKVWDKLSGEFLWEHKFNLEGKNCLVSFESSSLGDTIAWMSQIEGFVEKNKCNLYLSTFHNYLFEDVYPQINFINPGDVVNSLYSSYRIGWYYREDGEINYNLHPQDFRKIPLHQTSSDILGTEFIDKRPRIKITNTTKTIPGDYVTIGFHSTAQTKYWNNPDGWKGVVDFLKDHDISSVVISKEPNGWMGNFFPPGSIDKSGEYPLFERISDIYNSKMFIGLGSGLSWLAWAVGVPVVIISGFSDVYSEPSEGNIIRIHNSKVCNSCFNRYKLEAWDWNWCPDNKNTPDQFICTKSITSEMVTSKISDFLGLSQKVQKTDDNFLSSLVVSILEKRNLKSYTLFVKDTQKWNTIMSPFKMEQKKGVDIIITDKSPVMIYPLVLNLVNPSGVICLISDSFCDKFLELIKDKSSLKYLDPSGKGLIIVFV